MSTTRRFITASLALVAAACGLSACDAQQIGAAVVVDGDRFTVADLQDEVERVQALDGFDISAAGGMSSFQRDLLNRHIQHQIFRRLAADEDIDINPAAIDDAIDGFREQAPDGDLTPLLAQNGYTDDAFRDGVYDQLVAQEYTNANGGDQSVLLTALQETGDELDIEVNPRYGTWGEDLTVVADDGSISSPVDGGDSESPDAQPEDSGSDQ